jgi:PAS domain S-box-containing protein
MNEKISLLVVDDNEDNLLVLENLIKEYFPSVEIFTATSAIEGMQIAIEQQVDGALVDVQMPEMDGIDLCRRLKADKRTSHIALILLTSHQTVPELRVKGLEAGADDFIHRPFDNIEFVARVKVLLRIKRTEDQLREVNERLEARVEERTTKLRESEDKFSKAFYNHPVAMQIADIKTGERVDLNESFIQLFETEREVCQHTNIFADNFWLDPEQPQKGFEQLIKDRVVINYPMDAVTASGAIKNLLVSRSMLDIGDGNLAISSFIDITENKRAMEERELLMNAIEQTADAIVITDSKGTMQYVNPAFVRITGYTNEESIGRNPRILKSGEQDDAFYKTMWNELTRGKIWSGRLINKKKDGSLYTEEATISPVHDSSGAIINFVAVNRDITQECEAENRLRQSQKMEAVGILAGGVAHDFNNMLSVILGYTGMALKKTEPSHVNYRNLEAIRKAAERSAELTRQLLAFSRKQPLEPKVINLNDLLENLEKMLRRVVREDIDFKMVYTDNLDLVHADPGQIEQIIINLVTNARDAMPEGGKITIETTNVELDEQYAETHLGTRVGRYVLLSVSDAGCGMDEKTRERIFEPFFTTKAPGEGTGLGLSTVYGTVKQSGGYIWCSSEPDKGTTFKVYLPRTNESPALETEQDVSPVRDGDEEHILMVEDEEQVRSMLEAMLKELHYQVTVAENGEEALLLYQEQGFRPDLIITDVVMPGMGGKRLVEQVQKTVPEQKVLYMSGYTDDAIGHHGVLDADTNFIQKPFTFRGIAEKIEQVLTGGK